jgi:hypothetical protein
MPIIVASGAAGAARALAGTGKNRDDGIKQNQNGLARYLRGHWQGQN